MQEITKNKELQKNLANQINDVMLGKLYDIDGLDAVNWWPLAPGWWIIITVLILLSLIMLKSYLKKRAWKLSWRGQVFEKLDQMQKTVNQENAQEIAITLSQFVRRIAMHKYTRDDCAGLVGQDWLHWLTQHDGNNFDWVKNGRILTEEVFAGKNKKLSINTLNDLINATKNWVR